RRRPERVAAAGAAVRAYAGRDAGSVLEAQAGRASGGLHRLAAVVCVAGVPLHAVGRWHVHPGADHARDLPADHRPVLVQSTDFTESTDKAGARPEPCPCSILAAVMRQGLAAMRCSSAAAMRAATRAFCSSRAMFTARLRPAVSALTRSSRYGVSALPVTPSDSASTRASRTAASIWSEGRARSAGGGTVSSIPPSRPMSHLA